MNIVNTSRGDITSFQNPFDRDGLQLCDIIDKYLPDLDEQLIAEALGAIFYRRSLEKYDGRKRAISSFEVVSLEDKYDGSKYGSEYYKYLGYRLVIQTKQLSASVNQGRKREECFSWLDLLVIIYGPDAQRAIDNPRQFGYDHFS